MSAALADFLIELSDPRNLKRFRQDPEAVIAAADLTDPDRAALRRDLSGRTLQHKRSPAKPGALTVVGTGMSVGQLTTEARSWIECSNKVLYCVADVATERLIKKINPEAESLYAFYDDDKRRTITYEQMVQRALECVREGLDVCMVFYGHPGIFVYPSHEAIKRAKQEGYEARMLAAVSSVDCLFADLGIDPAGGCQMIEATDLLLRDRLIDSATHVIIWQIGCVGDFGFQSTGYDGRHLPVLAAHLVDIYGDRHHAIIYEAAQYNIFEPVMRSVLLPDLPTAGVTGTSTLYIPPKWQLPVDAAMAKRLDLYDIIKDKMIARERG